MNYEKKNKEAIKTLDAVLNLKCVRKERTIPVDDIRKIFPELAESEDEKIRKEMLDFFCQFEDKTLRGVDISSWIDWLEKQGEKEEINEASYRTGIRRVLDNPESYGLEKQGEQNPADKVEPKFKVGDWITNDACTIQITSMDNKYYWHDNNCVSGDIKSIDKEYHLWTIQDAKDGDVLVAKIDGEPNDFIYIFSVYDQNLGFWSHCYLDAYVNIFHEGIYHNNFNVGVPATKEQRDLLFKKMKEAGYEWYAEKKELKKIEQKYVEWSEEDEEMYDRIMYVLLPNEVDWLKSLKDRAHLQSKHEWSDGDKSVLEAIIDVFINNTQAGSDGCVVYKPYIDWLKSIKPQPKQEWSKEDEEMIKDIAYNLERMANGIISILPSTAVKYAERLKSLNPNHWKPSEEQIEAIEVAMRNATAPEYAESLEKLLDELKKL